MKETSWRSSLAVLLLALAPAGSLAQETPEPADGEADEATGEPEMAKAPLQFRLSATVGSILWGQKEGVVGLDNLVTFGIDIESRVAPPSPSGSEVRTAGPRPPMTRLRWP